MAPLNSRELVKREVNSKTGRLKDYKDIAKKRILKLQRLQRNISGFNPKPGRDRLKDQYREYLFHRD